jgi:EAL domain-containing protein (putative c-di-GMP-specific phosphodiesterase class I)
MWRCSKSTLDEDVKMAPTSSDVIPFMNLNRSSTMKLLKVALREKYIRPAFQPIVDLKTGRLTSFEVLARWDDPTYGAISPSMFIARLEEHGLIDILFDALLLEACSDAVGWPGEFKLAFNVSPIQLNGVSLPHRIAEASLNSGFPLDRVEVEVTESSLLSNPDRALETLQNLNELGVTIAVDDFGTGYSSLARLESFPFHKLKIDRQFVSCLDGVPSKRRIAAAIIGLGQSLGMIIVAEGVETSGEANVLTTLGCDLGQGWFYGKPQGAAHTSAVIERMSSCKSIVRSLDDSPFQQFHQLNTLYKQAPVGIAFVDMEYRHVRSNDRFASLHGLSGAALEGLHVDDVIQGSELARVKKVLHEAALLDQPLTEIYYLNGRCALVMCTRVVDTGNEVIGFSIVSLDMQDLTESFALMSETLKKISLTVSELPPISIDKSA